MRSLLRYSVLRWGRRRTLRTGKGPRRGVVPARPSHRLPPRSVTDVPEGGRGRVEQSRSEEDCSIKSSSKQFGALSAWSVWSKICLLFCVSYIVADVGVGARKGEGRPLVSIRVRTLSSPAPTGETDLPSSLSPFRSEEGSRSTGPMTRGVVHKGWKKGIKNVGSVVIVTLLVLRT